MILAGVLLCVSLFIHFASQAAGRSYADAVLQLAGRSVLSEYDLQLQRRYGLFAVHTDEKQVEEKIKLYAGYSFHDDFLKEVLRGRKHTDILRLKLNSVSVNLKGYSMTDAGLFEQQILEYMKYGIVKEVLFEENAHPPMNQESELKNQQIIASLPSKGYQSNFSVDLKNLIENGLPSLAEIKKNQLDKYLVNEYIMTHFLNRMRGHETRDTFFFNEVEYVLKGNFSDGRNYNAVRTDLFIMRNILNLLHITGDPEKRRKIAEVAAALTLIKGKEIGIAVVSEAWATAETVNDLRLLEAGKEVALIKGRDNWAVPLSSTLEYIQKEGYTAPKRMTGYDYEDYLRIFLFLEKREQKLFRCMDLIQINMKGSVNRNFDLKEHYGGFQFEAVAKDTKYTYVQKY